MIWPSAAASILHPSDLLHWETSGGLTFGATYGVWETPSLRCPSTVGRNAGAGGSYGCAPAGGSASR
jgi:hypothetical protein